MESQPQNPEFRINPETFNHALFAQSPRLGQVNEGFTCRFIGSLISEKSNFFLQSNKSYLGGKVKCQS